MDHGALGAIALQQGACEGNKRREAHQCTSLKADAQTRLSQSKLMVEISQERRKERRQTMRRLQRQGGSTNRRQGEEDDEKGQLVATDLKQVEIIVLSCDSIFTCAITTS